MTDPLEIRLLGRFAVPIGAHGPAKPAKASRSHSPPTPWGTRSTVSCSPARTGPRTPAGSSFSTPQSREFYPDWEKAANDAVAVLRAFAGRDPYDRCLSDLVGELSTQSDEFRTRWAQHNLRQLITGIVHFHHPVVGELSLISDRLDLLADPGLTMHTYTAEPGSRDEQTLRLLDSWTSTRENHGAAQSTEPNTRGEC